MRLIAATLFFILAFAIASHSQESASPLLIQKALDVVASQRNQAQGDAAIWQAKAILLSEELIKIQTRVKELESTCPKKD